MHWFFKQNVDASYFLWMCETDFECARISFYAVEKDNKMLKKACIINVYDYDNKLNNMITNSSLQNQEKNNRMWLTLNTSKHWCIKVTMAAYAFTLKIKWTTFRTQNVLLSPKRAFILSCKYVSFWMYGVDVTIMTTQPPNNACSET